MDSHVMEQFNSSLTENFFQESFSDVFEKYNVIEEMGRDELGSLSKVQPKDPSAVRIYCLKTIHLNRVSRGDQHHEELKNEISALKVCTSRANS